MTESSSNEQRNTDAAESGPGAAGTFQSHSGKGPHIDLVTGAPVGETADSGKGPHLNAMSLTDEPDSGKGPHAAS